MIARFETEIRCDMCGTAITEGTRAGYTYRTYRVVHVRCDACRMPVGERGVRITYDLCPGCTEKVRTTLEGLFASPVEVLRAHKDEQKIKEDE